MPLLNFKSLDLGNCVSESLSLPDDLLYIYARFLLMHDLTKDGNDNMGGEQVSFE